MESVAAKLRPALLVGEGFAAQDHGRQDARDQVGGEKRWGRKHDIVRDEDHQDPVDDFSLRKREQPTDSVTS